MELIENELFLTLPPSYQKAVEKVEQEFRDIPETDHRAKRDILLEFSLKYLMIKELWDIYFFERSNSLTTADFTHHIEEIYIVRKSVRYHFYEDKNHRKFKKLIHTRAVSTHELAVMNKEEITMEKIAAELSCPLRRMDHRLKNYEENWDSPIPKTIYKKFKETKKLYHKILEASENDINEWFRLITTVDNTAYIINNIEYKLGQDLNNIRLWKLYFDYLKQHDTKKLLHLYSRYCRYFIDDNETKNEYKKAAEIYGPIIVHWKNAFPFENYEKQLYIYRNSILKSFEATPKFFMENLSFDKNIVQTFSLPKTLVQYIIQKCEFENPNILYKLHCTCKSFFKLVPYPVYYNLNIYNCYSYNIVKFHGQSVAIIFSSISISDILFAQKFIISNTLHFYTKRSLQKLLLNVHHCNLKHLCLRDQNFTIKEFKFLVEKGNIETFYMEDCSLVDESNAQVGLHDIIKFMPKVTHFQMRKPYTSEETFEILPHLKFSNKFRFLILKDVSYFEPIGFCEFLKNILSDETGFVTVLDHEMEKNAKDFAINFVKRELQKFLPDMKFDIH